MPEPVQISIFGVTIPVHRWTRGAFSLIAVVGVAVLGYQQLFPPTIDLVSLKRANDKLAAEIAEFGLHMADAPEHAFDDADGNVSIKVFRDHCVLIQRKGTTQGVLTRLVTDLARQPVETQALISWPVVEAAGQSSCSDRRFVHSGRFETRSVRRSECLIEVWRTYEDGCEHFQLFDPCRNAWHTNQDGSPSVSWTRCTH